MSVLSFHETIQHIINAIPKHKHIYDTHKIIIRFAFREDSTKVNIVCYKEFLYDAIRITSLIFLFGFGISLSTFFCYEKIKKKCIGKKCKDDKCIQCNEHDLAVDDDLYSSLCNDDFLETQYHINNTINKQCINYTTFNIECSPSLNISPIKNKFYKFTKTISSTSGSQSNEPTRSRFSLPNVWSFNNLNDSFLDDNIYDGIQSVDLDEIPGFSTPDINETGQNTEDSLQSLQNALNSLKQDISCLGDDVIATSIEQSYGRSTSDSGCKTSSNSNIKFNTSSPKISTSDFYIDDDLLFDVKMSPKPMKRVKNVAIVNPFIQMKIKEENWKVENISLQKNIFEMLDHDCELNNQDFRLHRMAYIDLQECFGCETLNIIRKDNYGMLRAVLYKTMITNNFIMQLPMLQIVIEKIMREEEFVFLNNWHFANRLPYSANDVRSMMHDCLSLLIDQIKHINMLYKNKPTPIATSSPCSNNNNLIIPEEVKQHFISFVNSNPINDLKLLEATKLLMIIRSIDIHTSNDKLNSSIYQIYSEIKSKSTKHIVTLIDNIGDTKDCDDLELGLLADTLHVNIIKVNVRNHLSNNVNAPASQFLTKYNCSCTNLCEIIVSIDPTNIILFN